MAEKTGITRQVGKAILDVLEACPDGIRRRDLVKKIYKLNPAKYNKNTIRAQISRFKQDGETYISSPGIHRLTKFQSDDENEEVVEQTTIEEKKFYAPFAEYLTDDLGECTKAISLGGATFRHKWGTPDVIGIKDSLKSDIISAPIEIISAEIKTDTSKLVTAFGQACAYCLFSHRSYLVVPRQASEVEISRLDSLCQVFGVGLVLFDRSNSEDPDFNIRVRGRKQNPDLSYTNQYLKPIEKKLF